ncbi:MAG: hypothetical protein IJX87_01505 [Clostridia bacterium]|nr:hypothetical protein [Clostridia bacterium]
MTKMIKKGTLWSVIIAVILVAACALGIVFGGFNGDASMKNANTITVTMNTFAYNNQLDEVQDVCDDAFASFDVVKVIKGGMSGDECELVYVFDEDVDLTAVKTNLRNTFDAKTADGAEWDGTFITVSSAKENVSAVLAQHYVLRGVIAGVVFAVLAFAYVALRYNLRVGIVSGIVTLVGMAVTAALVMLVRIPVTASVAYAVAASGLLSAATALLTFAKIRANEQIGEKAEDAIGNNVAVKEIGLLTLLGVVAFVLIGGASAIFGGLTAIVWFSVAVVVAFVVAAFMGMVYAPALYLPFKKAVDAKNVGRTKSDYVGAVKTSTKVKKTYEKKKAAPVEEKKAEDVKEEPVKEVAEEKVEEVVEPEAEEVAEEVAEPEAEEVAEATEEEKKDEAEA